MTDHALFGIIADMYPVHCAVYFKDIFSFSPQKMPAILTFLTEKGALCATSQGL